MQNIILMQALPYDPAAQMTIVGPPFPGGGIDYPTFRQLDLYGRQSERWAATLDYTNFRLFPLSTDSSLDRLIPGCIREALNYDVRLFQGLEPGGRSQSGAGEIVIDDADDELATWMDLGWDQREIRLWRGGDRAVFVGTSDFEQVARLTCDGIEQSGRQKIIRLRTLDWMLQRPLHVRTYGGTGGRDGGADIAGRVMPLLFGYRRSFAPIPVDAPNRVFQFNFGPSHSVEAVRDGGSPLTFVADYPTYEALIAASLSLGQYATCLAESMIRLGGNVARSLTMGAYKRAEADCTINDILTDLVSGGPGREWFPLSAVDGLPSGQNTDEGVNGLYLPEPIQIAEALDRLAAGIEGYWLVTLGGELRLRSLEAPGTPAFTFDYPSDILSEPTGETIVPRAMTMVGWGPVDQVQGGGDLADGTTTADRALYGAAWRFAIASSDAALAKHPSDRRVQVPGNYRDEAPAIARANTSQGLYGVRSDTWTIRVALDPFAQIVGETVRITNHPKFGASADFRCVGIAAVESRGEVDLRLRK